MLRQFLFFAKKNSTSTPTLKRQDKKRLTNKIALHATIL
jgi:hypothetical protein